MAVAPLSSAEMAVQADGKKPENSSVWLSRADVDGLLLSHTKADGGCFPNSVGLSARVMQKGGLIGAEPPKGSGPRERTVFFAEQLRHRAVYRLQTDVLVPRNSVLVHALEEERLDFNKRRPHEQAKDITAYLKRLEEPLQYVGESFGIAMAKELHCTIFIIQRNPKAAMDASGPEYFVITIEPELYGIDEGPGLAERLRTARARLPEDGMRRFMHANVILFYTPPTVGSATRAPSEPHYDLVVHPQDWIQGLHDGSQWPVPGNEHPDLWSVHQLKPPSPPPPSPERLLPEPALQQQPWQGKGKGGTAVTPRQQGRPAAATEAKVLAAETVKRQLPKTPEQVIATGSKRTVAERSPESVAEESKRQHLMQDSVLSPPQSTPNLRRGRSAVENTVQGAWQDGPPGQEKSASALAHKAPEKQAPQGSSSSPTSSAGSTVVVNPASKSVPKPPAQGAKRGASASAPQPVQPRRPPLAGPYVSSKSKRPGANSKHAVPSRQGGPDVDWPMEIAGTTEGTANGDAGVRTTQFEMDVIEGRSVVRLMERSAATPRPFSQPLGSHSQQSDQIGGKPSSSDANTAPKSKSSKKSASSSASAASKLRVTVGGTKAAARVIVNEVASPPAPQQTPNGIVKQCAAKHCANSTHASKTWKNVTDTRPCFVLGCNHTCKGAGEALAHVREQHKAPQDYHLRCLASFIGNKPMYLCSACNQPYLQKGHEVSCLAKRAALLKQKANAPRVYTAHVGNGVTSQVEVLMTAEGVQTILLQMADLPMELIFMPARTVKDVPNDSRILAMWYDLLRVVLSCRPNEKKGAEQERWMTLWVLIPRIIFSAEKQGGAAPSSVQVKSRLGNFAKATADLLRNMQESAKLGTQAHAGKPASSLASEEQPAGAAPGFEGGVAYPPEIARRMHELLKVGLPGRAWQLALSLEQPNTNVIKPNDANIEAIRALFPQESHAVGDPQVLKDILNTPLPAYKVPAREAAAGAAVERASIKSVLESSAKLSAVGNTVWKAEFLNNSRHNQPVLAALQMLTDDFAEGRIPASHAPFFLGGRGIFWTKEDGGIRPVAARDFIDKSASRMFSTVLMGKAGAILAARHQYGVGASAGCETVVNAVRAMLQDVLEGTDQHGVERLVLATFDIKNAFGRVSRALIRAALIYHHLEYLLPHFDAHYPTQNDCVPTLIAVHKEDGSTEYIKTLNGVHPGDPMGSFYFAIGMDLFLARAIAICGGEEQFVNAFLGAILDDINLVATPVLIMKFAKALVQANEEMGAGLELKISKTKIFPATAEVRRLFAEDNTFAEAKMIPVEGGLRLVGFPVGSVEFCREFWIEEMQRLSIPAMQRLCHLENVQDRLLLARYCAVGRTAYMMRSAHPVVTSPAARMVDQEVVGLIRSFVFDGDLTEAMIIQAGLPLRLGGLGLTPATGAGEYAYVASVTAAFNVITEKGENINLEIPLIAALKKFFTATPSITEAGRVPALHQPEPPDGNQSDGGGGEGDPQAMQQDSNTQSGQQQSKGSVSAIYQQVLSWTHSMGDKLNREAVKLKRHTGLPLTDHELADVPSNTFEALCSTRPKLQHRLAALRAKLVSAQLVVNAPTARAAALLVAVKQKGATGFLQAIPSDHRLTVTNDVMKLAISTLLGSPRLEEKYSDLAEKCPVCGLHKGIDTSKPNHRDNCKLGGAGIHRHNALAYVAQQAYLSMGNSIRLEPRAELPGQGKGGPDGRGVGQDGVPFLLEVSYVNPCNEPAASAKEPLSSTIKREAVKDADWQTLAKSSGFRLDLLVMQTTGGMGPKSQKTLRDMSKAYHAKYPHAPVPTAPTGFASAPTTTWAAPTADAYWTQAFSVAAVRGAFYYAKVVELNAGASKPAPAGKGSHNRPPGPPVGDLGGQMPESPPQFNSQLVSSPVHSEVDTAVSDRRLG